MGIGDWGLGIGPNPQSPTPIPNPQSPIPNPHPHKILFKNLIIHSSYMYYLYIIRIKIFYYLLKYSVYFKQQLFFLRSGYNF